MSNQLKRACKKYEEAVHAATGQILFYANAQTPFLEEETKASPHRAPWNNESYVECPNCLRSIPKTVADSVTFPSGHTRKITDSWETSTFEEMAQHKDCEETADDATDYVGSDGETSDSEFDDEYDGWDAMCSKVLKHSFWLLLLLSVKQE
jgi:hypothetical protein